MSAKYFKKANVKKNEQGFTLVELAIVLVVIGFIVSGVLVGQDMIKASQLRAISRQFNEYQVGVTTFINKYNGIPGDMSNASNKFGFTAPVAGYYVGTAGNGDGDGTIQSAAAGIAAFTGEMSTFWSYLTTPGKELISGSYAGNGCTSGTIVCTAGVDFPAIKGLSQGWGVYGVTGVNYLAAGVTSASSATTTPTSTTFIPNDAYGIDVKIDDGVPNTGNVQSMAPHATVMNTNSTAAAASASAATCDTNSTPREYQYQVTTAQCYLRFQLQTF